MTGTIRIFALFWAALSCQAATIIFVSPPGATSAGLPVNVKLEFITSANQLEMRIYNNQQEVNQGSVAQTISAVDWLLSGTPGTPTLFSSAGNLITLTRDPTNKNYATFASAGNLSALPVCGAKPCNRWTVINTPAPNATSAGAQIAGGTQITTLSGGNPYETILGPSNTPTQYLANNGLLGDNPFLQTANGAFVDFIIRYNQGVTVNSNVTRARVSFNTAFDTTTELELVVLTPEPGTWATLGAGVLLLIALQRRFRQQRA